MDIDLFFGAAKTCIFKQCITFHPNTYVFANIRRVPKCVQFAGCSLNRAM